MQELTVAILVAALFNVSMALIDNKNGLRFGIVIYWILVSVYWFKRT